MFQADKRYDWGEKRNECGRPMSAIIYGNMKLIHDYETATNYLYDIVNDIGEAHDLIGTNKKNDKVAAKLAKILSNKLREENSPMPTYKDSGKKCPYPDEALLGIHKKINK